MRPRLTSPAMRLLAGFGVMAMVAGTLVATGAVLSHGSDDENRAPRVISEIPVTPMDQSLGAAHNSPVVLADPTEERFLAMANRLDAPDFGCALQVSGDGGRGWVSARPVTKLPTGAEKCYAPEIAFGDDGVLYYLFVGLHGQGNEPMGVFLTTSSDRAQSFSPPRRVLGPLRFGVRMALDPTMGPNGRLHLVWLEATSDPPAGGFGPPPNPVLAAHSDDGGKTFTKPVTVAGGDGERVVAPALALGPDHTVHVAWYDLGDDARDYQGLEGPVWEGRWSLWLASSSDGGRRFSPPGLVDGAVVPHERVMLIFTMPPATMVDDGTRLCAGWTDAARGDADAVLRCSQDGGRHWGPLRRLNDDPAGNGSWQYLPRLSLSPGGRIDAVFYDRRRDGTNLLADVYATFSTDGGRRFAPNIRLNRENFDSDIGQQYLNPAAVGQYEFGARLGLLSHRSGALAVWADTRNSRPQTTSQDLFAALVGLPAPARPATAPRVAGTLLAGAGAVAVGGSALAGRRRRDPGTPAEES